MTATEEVRRLLDERGVKYAFEQVKEGTLFHVSTDGEAYYFILVRDNDAGIEVWSQYLTPQQAIDATLGRGEWYDEDGTLHIRCHRLPDSIDVTLPDSRGREVYSARVHSFERRKECHDTKTFTSWRLFTCSNCRAQVELNAIHSADRKIGGIPLKFCPNCGAKVVDA